MGKDLWESSARVKDLFRVAAETTGMNVEKLLFEGTEEELKATDKTQVAVTLVNAAAAAVLEEKGLHADGFAGFSLGEYTALYQAGVLRLEDLFPIVKVRGELMEKAARALDTPGQALAGMAAVLGLGYAEAVKVLEGMHGEKIYLANYSSPQQIVLGGTGEAIQKAQEAFKAAGARRYVILKVSAPFHTPLLEEARAALEQVLAGYRFADPGKPVYSNVTGRRVASGEEARRLCIQQAVTTVRWVDEETSLLADGFERCLEVGPGTVLAGLWKAFSGEIPCLAAGKLEEINKLLGVGGR